MKPMSDRGRVAALVCAVVISGITPVALADEGYRVAPLGEFGPGGLSDAGQVAGQLGGTAVLYDGSVLRALGTLAPPGQIANSAAFGISPSGIVVGASGLGSLPPTIGETHAFVYTGGAMVDIDQRPGATYSVGLSINDAGHATGYASFDGVSGWHAMLYRNGGLNDLGSLDGFTFSHGTSINSLDQVAGYAMRDDLTTMRAFFHDGSTMHDLGTLGGASSMATSINDAGTIVGNSDTGDGHRHGFVWQDGVMRDVGTLGGDDTFVAGIGADGTIFGTSALPDGSGRAFMLVDGVMSDVNTMLAPGSDPGCVLDGVFGINARGQVGAVCTEPTGAQSVFLLTAVPEPTSAALMALGLAGFGIAARRRGRDA